MKPSASPSRVLLLADTSTPGERGRGAIAIKRYRIARSRLTRDAAPAQRSASELAPSSRSASLVSE